MTTDLPYIIEIKRALSIDLSEGNALIQKSIATDDFKNVALSYIEANIPFFREGIERYQLLTIPDDADTPDKKEPDTGTLLGVSYFIKYVRTIEDVCAHMMHVLCHELCDQMWSKIAFPMETFSVDQLDFMEEIYNQRIVDVVAPRLHAEFPRVLKEFETHNREITDYRAQVQTTLTHSAVVEAQSLQMLHAWLYQSNPLQLQVFDTYMRMWKQMFDVDPEIKALSKNYIHSYNRRPC